MQQAAANTARVCSNLAETNQKTQLVRRPGLLDVVTQVCLL